MSNPITAADLAAWRADVEKYGFDGISSDMTLRLLDEVERLRGVVKEMAEVMGYIVPTRIGGNQFACPAHDTHESVSISMMPAAYKDIELLERRGDEAKDLLSRPDIAALLEGGEA